MASLEPAGPTPARGGARHRGRRPRRGNGGQRNAIPQSNAEAGPDLTSQPNPVSSNPPSAPTDPPLNNSRGRNGRRGGNGGRGGRGGGRRGGGVQVQPMVNGQRTFGGLLTSNTADGPVPGLAADAPVFEPGKPVIPRARNPQAPRPRRMSKSQAPDIATRTHEDITNGQYECSICTNEVMPNSKIWNCKTCWSVLHLSCAKKWSKNDSSTLQQRGAANGDLPPPRQWRCPGCNLPKNELPTSYTCWCQKEVEPRSIAGLPPHSCGQTCSKPRIGHCPHPCELICHAGPCPPCRLMGPSMSCFCGKETSSRRCLDTNYETGWSCAQVCGDILPCGEHTCQRSCHEGLCGSCEVMIDSRCYCGRVKKELPCSERDDEHESILPVSSTKSELETWTGSFNCGDECRRPYDCGNEKHYCESKCHPQTLEPAHCPFSPDVVSHCPCGKTPLDILLPEPRTSCSDSIPHCQERCQKDLVCGHLCEQICHQGECRPCLQTVLISCRCGRTSSKTVCHQGVEEPPSCTRVCRSTLNCGRHECGERCCPGEKKASERQIAKRKKQPLSAIPRPGDENFEAEHICLRTCGRPLKCGNHTCAELCHKGPCSSCLEAIFDEISCACGRTVLQPPQPCGTRPPECRYECTRQRTCGHPQIKHQCHEDTEPCPKCPFLVEKQCICGKRTLKNQPCWFSEVRCGLPCGKKLKCGIHYCQKACHRPGDCEDAAAPCSQLCGRRKTVCDHTCSDPCHAPYPCKEVTPCQAKTFVTCQCQHQKQAAKCLASKSSEGNSKKTLDCNDECLKLQRNAKLAAALDIDPTTHTDDHVPYSQQTLDMYKATPKFAQTYEREFRVFAADESEKRLRFKPMQASQRAFIHSLAEDFGLDSESQDPEPHRHVCIFKTPRFVSAPMKTLGQCLKLKAVAVVDAAPPSKGLVSTAEPFNAFLLASPKFGLTVDELQADLLPELSTTPLSFEISFLPSGEIVVKGQEPPSWHVKVESTMVSLKAGLTRRVKSLGLASSVTLCHVDPSLNILRREDDHAGGGWSQVAKGASAGRSVPQASVGVKSSFTVLGSKGLGAKKKKVEEDAVDDWEREVDGWENE
ncbi:nf-x1 finger transcription [Phlyctema vagabunda]|uniref:Nf-x1 finger transcription n=1 Tax=Phlyctema vagabunda TaxID=108571 RepID=A0ABR4P3U2_9HELO